jgi:hypothetical protein
MSTLNPTKNLDFACRRLKAKPLSELLESVDYDLRRRIESAWVTRDRSLTESTIDDLGRLLSVDNSLIRDIAVLDGIADIGEGRARRRPKAERNRRKMLTRTPREKGTIVRDPDGTAWLVKFVSDTADENGNHFVRLERVAQ